MGSDHDQGLRVIASDLSGPIGTSRGRAFAQLATVRGVCVVLFRLSQEVGRIHPLMGLVVKQINHLLTGADIAWQARIGPGLQIFHPTGVVIGPDVVIGARCQLRGQVTLGAARSRGRDASGQVDSPVVSDDVQIGVGAAILGPIRIGASAIVGANSVVLNDIPDHTTAVGAPARVIGEPR